VSSVLYIAMWLLGLSWWLLGEFFFDDLHILQAFRCCISLLSSAG